MEGMGPFTCSLNDYRAAKVIEDAALVDAVDAAVTFHLLQKDDDVAPKSAVDNKLGPFTCSLNDYRAANPLWPLISPPAKDDNDNEVTLFCRKLQVLADDFIAKHENKRQRIYIMVKVQEI